MNQLQKGGSPPLAPAVDDVLRYPPSGGNPRNAPATPRAVNSFFEPRRHGKPRRSQSFHGFAEENPVRLTQSHRVTQRGWSKEKLSFLPTPLCLCASVRPFLPLFSVTSVSLCEVFPFALFSSALEVA